ncbi:Gamma-aminobutyric acid type B receptor subunit 1 [Acropora cervicornis]|uniref:Gamma-aminobutyric acid type B receptor subunit 1 n=1 Tax=Acropora cervicornis TaxID=6130 RepID=A0AAD9PVL1_ACRCE|nr:Gamma-aminobutyric acid type B receptor subunit 1 [Acropora cervicornis]
MQRVVVDGYGTEYVSINRGVPQGTVLGPVLFSIFINDIKAVNTDKNLLVKFADDITVSLPIEASVGLDESETEVQSFIEWSEKNCMQVNFTKTWELLLRGKTTRTPPEPLEIIGRKEKLKLLGVTFEQVPVNWDTHIDYLLSKASSRLYILRICKYYGYTTENLDLLFQSLILSVFVYAIECDPGHAATTLFESLYNGPQLIMLLGAACPASTRAITQIGGIWNLLQVSYASIPTDLSNERKHPLLYSTVPSYSAQNRAKIAFLNHFQWKRIATIRENDYAFGEVMGSFQQDLVNSGLELIAAETVQDNPKSQLTNLKNKDARIIVGMFYEDQARKVLCEGEEQCWCIAESNDHPPILIGSLRFDDGNVNENATNQ